MHSCWFLLVHNIESIVTNDSIIVSDRFESNTMSHGEFSEFVYKIMQNGARYSVFVIQQSRLRSRYSFTCVKIFIFCKYFMYNWRWFDVWWADRWPLNWFSKTVALQNQTHHLYCIVFWFPCIRFYPLTATVSTLVLLTRTSQTTTFLK